MLHMQSLVTISYHSNFCDFDVSSFGARIFAIVQDILKILTCAYPGGLRERLVIYGFWSYRNWFGDKRASKLRQKIRKLNFKFLILLKFELILVS